ncbi:MAG: DMT family transporter [Rhodomicrobiaceae bacterium]
MAHDATLASRASNETSGYVLAAVGAILFSMKAIFVKLAYGGIGAPEVGAITLLALRMAFSVPVYLAVGAVAWRGRLREGRPLPTAYQAVAAVLVGILGYYGASYLDFEGLVYLTAQFERLILFTYPFFVMLLGALFFAGQVTGWGALSLLLAYAGISVIFLEGAIAKGDHAVLGAVFVLGAAFCFALYQLLAKSLITRMGSRIFTCIAMTGASAAVLLHFMAESSVSVLFDVPARIVSLAALLAIISTVLPSFMLNAALDRVGPQAVSVLGTLSPAATIVMAIIFLGEPFTPADAAGTLLVMAGVGLFTWRDALQKEKARQAAGLASREVV